MERLTAKTLDLPTTIQEYCFNCPQFTARHERIVRDWNGQVYLRRIAEIKDIDLRAQAKALFDFFTKCSAIIWTLLDMPLQEYDMTVEKALQKLHPVMYRKCALAIWKDWASYANPRLTVDIRSRIESGQVIPDGFEFDTEHFNQKTLDKWCKKFGLTCWAARWTPQKITVTTWSGRKEEYIQ